MKTVLHKPHKALHEIMHKSRRGILKNKSKKEKIDGSNQQPSKEPESFPKVDEHELYENVQHFIHKQRDRGLSKEEVKNLIIDSPYPENIINEAMVDNFGLDAQVKKVKEKLLSHSQSIIHNKYQHRHHFYSPHLEKFKPSRMKQHLSGKKLPSDEQIDNDFSMIKPNPLDYFDASDISINANNITVKTQPKIVDSLKGDAIDSKMSLIEEQIKNIRLLNPGDEYRNPLLLDKIELVEKPVGDRIQTGIQGFDQIMEGGLMRYSMTMVAGGPGSGKSTLGLQYLYKGAKEYNEPGVYITFEQQANALNEAGIMFGWDIEALVKQGKLTIREYTPEHLDKMLKSGGGSFRDLIDSMGAKRIVIDSITAFLLLYTGEIAQRRACLQLFHDLAKWGCTAIVIVEEEQRSGGHRSTVLEYETDGVVILYNERHGDIRQRALEIFKMRNTKHAGRIFPMKLTSDGLIVLPEAMER